MKDGGSGKRPARPAALFAVVALLVFVVASLPSRQTQPAGTPSEMDFSQVAAYAKSGQLSRITVDGDNLEVALSDGTVAKSRKEPGLGLTQSLRNYGVTDAQLSRIDLRVKGQSDWGWLSSSLWLLPLLFLALLMILFMRQGGSQANGGNVFSFAKSRARRITADQPSVHFSDVAGVDEAKEELQEVVDFLRSPQRF
ncbi:MAG: hypothetical protein M1602_05230, partial [Firmicutes bacterium]|nr:hypothetical protein [Bacillota bacterium]